MEVLDDDTGLMFQLRPTPEWQAESAEFWERRRCKHPEKELRQRTVAGGQIQRREQCLVCGWWLGNSLKAVPGESLPLFDENLEQAYDLETKTERRSFEQKHVRLQKIEADSWSRKYAEYLKSPEWRARRGRVLERAQGLCEGCREMPATEVHHLSYDHAFEEFLFELVALCGPCHDRWHGHDEQGFEELPCCGCRFSGDSDPDARCGKFDMPSARALSHGGPCGPKAKELEPLK